MKHLSKLIFYIVACIFLCSGCASDKSRRTSAEEYLNGNPVNPIKIDQKVNELPVAYLENGEVIKYEILHEKLPNYQFKHINENKSFLGMSPVAPIDGRRLFLDIFPYDKYYSLNDRQKIILTIAIAPKGDFIDSSYRIITIEQFIKQTRFFDNISEDIVSYKSQGRTKLKQKAYVLKSEIGETKIIEELLYYWNPPVDYYHDTIPLYFSTSRPSHKIYQVFFYNSKILLRIEIFNKYLELNEFQNIAVEIYNSVNIFCKNCKNCKN